MLEEYLIIHKSILPEYYEKVVSARRLLDEGKAKDVSQAARMAGISRSTFYKYKDYILEPSEMAEGRKAVITVMLTHAPGVLSALMTCISETGASVLTITQTLPVHNRASVTICLDISAMKDSITKLIEDMSQVPGVEKPRLTDLD